MEHSPYEIIPLSPQEALVERDGILDVYREAFAPPPYSRTEIDVSNFSHTFARHLEREGLRCFAACEIPTGSIAGFVYGYTSIPGQWWHDLVEKEMDEGQAGQWLANGFEIVELAVHPRLQGKGAGVRLHDIILEGLPHQTALLSTIQAETVALKLYRRRGWVTLLQNFFFPGTLKPYQIMGLMFPGRG